MLLTQTRHSKPLKVNTEHHAYQSGWNVLLFGKGVNISCVDCVTTDSNTQQHSWGISEWEVPVSLHDEAQGNVQVMNLLNAFSLSFIAVSFLMRFSTSVSKPIDSLMKFPFLVECFSWWLNGKVVLNPKLFRSLNAATVTRGWPDKLQSLWLLAATEVCILKWQVVRIVWCIVFYNLYFMVVQLCVMVLLSKRWPWSMAV